MAEPLPELAERLAAARQEAEALLWYFARHSPAGLEDKTSDAYRELLDAFSAAAAKSDEDGYKALMIAYRHLAHYTFTAQEVHGRSILDTLRKPVGFGAKLRDKRARPVALGVCFLILGLALQLLDAWSKTELGAGSPTLADAQATALTASTGSLGGALLASCVPLLIPVAWGGLGACTALAKRVSDRLSAMSYEENRMQGLLPRVFLGAALALVLDILVFVEGSSSPEAATAGLGFGPIAAAFLAGLFVQHIYGALEAMMRRVSRALSPESSAVGPSSPPVRPSPDQ